MAIIDANELGAGTELRSQVCIVGGGPVGIALALELARLGVDSLVLEAGGTEREPEIDDLYRGESRTLGDLTSTRVQALGGATNHWGGQSRPFEPIDFEAQPWRGDAGWPIPREEALGRLDDAMAFLGLGGPGWAPQDWFPEDVLAGDATLAETVFLGKPLPVGEHYAPELEASERITVVLYANVTEVRVDPASGSVTGLEVATPDGVELAAVGEVYVVAAGGIESARLLLTSTSDVPAGVGNGADLVGRYFSDHHSTGLLPFVPGPGIGRFSSLTPEHVRAEVGEALPDDIEVLRALTVPDEAQRALGIPGFHAFLLPMGATPLDEIFALGVEGVVNPGIDDPGEIRSILVGFEQVPNPESRVIPSEFRNVLGLPRANVQWRLTEEDQDNMQRVVDLLARFLARSGIGRIATVPPAAEWRHAAFPQHHHMGTLRMGATPAEGVVDTDQRFFDVPNLFAAGSAVFPTYGHVNPTLNAVAMTYRLADVVAAEVGG